MQNVCMHIRTQLYVYNHNLGIPSLCLLIYMFIVLRIFSPFFLSKRWPYFKLWKALSPVELANRSWKQTIVFCCLATTYCEWKTKRWQLLPHPDTHCSLGIAAQATVCSPPEETALPSCIWGRWSCFLWRGMFLKRTFQHFVTIRITLLLWDEMKHLISIALLSPVETEKCKAGRIV